MLTLVTGSRGRVGSALVPLPHQGGHAVRAASRTPDRLTLPAGVPAVACDLGDPTTFAAALDGADAVFLYAEPSQIDAFLTAAQQAGVGHIVLLSSSSVLAPDPEGNPIAVVHHAAEEAVLAAPIPSTLLRPGAFATNAHQWSGQVRAHGGVDLPPPREPGQPPPREGHRRGRPRGPHRAPFPGSRLPPHRPRVPDGGRTGRPPGHRVRHADHRQHRVPSRLEGVGGRRSSPRRSRTDCSPTGRPRTASRRT